MPISYNPGIQDQRAQITSQMFQNLSGDLQQFGQQQRIEQAKREALAYQNTKNQAMLDSVRGLTDSQGNPLISPEEMLKIHEAKTPEQAGALLEAGLGNAAFKIAQDKAAQSRQYQGSQIANAYADAALRRAQANKIMNPPPGPANANQPVMLNGKEVGRYGPTGEPHFYPQQAVQSEDGPIPLDPVIDPNTGKRLQGKAINRKTGAEVDTSGENPSVVTLDSTGAFYLDNKSKSWKPIPASTVMAQKVGQIGQQPAQQPPGYFANLVNAVKGQQPAGGVSVQGGTAQPPLPAATPTGQPVAAAPAGVRVKSPDGKFGFIPADQVQAALAQGYVAAPQ